MPEQVTLYEVFAGLIQTGLAGENDVPDICGHLAFLCHFSCFIKINVSLVKACKETAGIFIFKKVLSFILEVGT